MKRINFKILTLTLSSLLLLGSCGEYGKGSASLANVSVGDIVEIQGTMDDNSKSFVRSICSRLRAMRMDLQTVTDINSVKFSVNYGSCMANDSTRSITANLNADYKGNASLEEIQTSGSSLIENQVQTDQSGVLADFCTAISNNVDVDTVYQNYATQGIIYTFPNSNTFIRSLVIDNSQTVQLVEKQTYVIESNSDADRNVLVEKIEYQSLCANDNAKTDTQYLIEYN